MGAFAGALAGLGNEVRNENLINMGYRHAANEQMAQLLEGLAASVDPNYRARYLTAAYQLRTADPSKKGKSPVDINQIIEGHIRDKDREAMAAASAVPQTAVPQAPAAAATNPAMGIPENLPAAPPPSPGLMSPPPDTTLPPPPAQAAPASPNAQAGAPQALQTPAPPPGQAQQIGIGAPPGQPSPGFSATIPPPPATNANTPMPYERGNIRGNPVLLDNGNISTWPTQEQAAYTAAQAEAAKQRALQGVSVETLGKLQQATGANAPGAPRQHYKWQMTTRGPVFGPDTGVAVAGLTVGANGLPVHRRIYQDQTEQEFPVPEFKEFKVLQRPDGSPGLYALGRNGEVIGEVDTHGATPYPPAAFATTVSDSVGKTVRQIYNPVTKQMENQIVPLDTHRETRKEIPGHPSSGRATLAPPPGKAAAPAPTPHAAGSGGSPGTGLKSLGPTAAQYKLNIQNPYENWASQSLEQNDSSRALIDHALELIGPHKDDNSPAPEAVTNLLYNIGISTGQDSDLINLLKLGGITAAGRLLKTGGGTRAVSVFNEAFKHTPGTLNSFKLMWEKLMNIRRALDDIDNATRKYGLKNPGLTTGLNPPPGNTSTPMPAGTTEEAPPVSMLKEGVDTTFKNGQTWRLTNGKPERVTTVH